MSGGEPFEGLEASVADFWSFAFSDLRTNVVRGVLAEFLVAKAVGAKELVRHAWDNYDVISAEGITIEVKSSAYLQSWVQKRHSTVRFSGLSGLAWDAEAGMGEEREYRAQVYVFAIQTCQVPSEYDALDISQWDFYVAPVAVVSEYGARSVGLGFLTAHARGPLPWGELATAVREAAT